METPLQRLIFFPLDQVAFKKIPFPLIFSYGWVCWQVWL